MNQKHLYEKHLAEKLVQLPPPGDPDQNWQQMKTLLDKNMPRGGGSGPGGSYRWWIAGTVVVAVLVGTWFGGKQLLTSEQRNEVVAGKIKTVNNKTAPAVALTDKKSDLPAMPPALEKNEGAKPATTPADPKGAAYASVTEPQENSNAIPAADDQQNEAVVKNSTDAKNNAVVNNQPAGNKTAAGGDKSAASNNELLEKAEHERSSPLLTQTGNNNPVVPLKTTNKNNKTSTDRKNIYSSGKKDRNKTRTINSKLNGNNTPDNITDNEVLNNEPARTNSTKTKKGKTVKPVNKAVAADNNYSYSPSISLPSQPTSGAGLLKESPVAITVDYTGAAVVAPSGVLQREFTYYKQADLFPDMVVRNKSSHRKSSRSSDASEDKRFAFGLSLPLAFPLGDQQALGYNRQAGVNTISDYIPSPHFQYHFNNKTYVQTGVQFGSPQFIHPFLLYENQQNGWRGPNRCDTITSISARKLYYFNIPVSVYHSPLRNFYMGTGLQFSSLLSGVAYYEQIQRNYSPLGPPQDYLIKNDVTKFQNDSLSNRLNRNEVRLIIDMNYYFNRFTVGLMYNQAFNNYVSFQVTPNSPYTFDKNKSLQFYLRYNIWEDKKRKQPKNMLTLK
jgi:hypothetical protein